MRVKISNVRRALVTIVLSVSALAASAGKYYWKPNGTGGWSSPDRWAVGTPDGGPGVPTSGGTDACYFYSVRAEITDADAAFVSSLYEIVLGTKATIVLNMTTNVVFGVTFQGSESTVLKLNDNIVDMSNTRSTLQVRGGDIVVSNGVLRLGKQFAKYASTFHVWKPGVLELPALGEYFTVGVGGDGLIRNATTSGVRLKFIGSRYVTVPGESTYLLVKPPYEFSGMFSGNPDNASGTLAVVAGSTFDGNTTWGPLGQRFTGTNSTVRMDTPRFYSGIFEMASVGSTNGCPSSVGNVDRLSFFNETKTPDDETGFVYLGTNDEVTARGADLYYRSLGTTVSFDAGARGGLTFGPGKRGEIINMTGEKSYPRAYGTTSRLVLRGSNTVESVISTSIVENCPTNALAIVKQGSGTWYIKGEQGAAGPFMVEQGNLRFDSLAARGTPCALGTADLLYTNWYGSASFSDYAVPYAWLLGDGRADVATADLATLEYSGAMTGFAVGRPLAVKGAGRVCGDSASLRLVGATSATPGTHALVLDGTTTENLYRDVTNGVGVLKVVKKGSGTWRLTGDVTLGGGVEVRAGKLKVSNRYTWYRLNMKEPIGAVGDQVWFGFRLFGMWDADGNLLTTGLAGRELDGKTEFLGAGETALALSTNDYSNSRAARSWINGAMKYGSVADPLNPTAGALFRMRLNAATTANILPKAAEESTWVRGVIHLPENAAAAVAYDMRAEESDNAEGRPTELKAFGLDGSPDGLAWTPLHSVDNNDNWGKAGNWHSTKAATRKMADGFRLDGKTRDATKTISIASMRVDGGAELDVEPESGVTVGGVTYDLAAGGGTISGGLSLGESGTLALIGQPVFRSELRLPMDLSKVDGLVNAASWAVTVNGSSVTWKASADADGFTVSRPGLLIMVR